MKAADGTEHAFVFAGHTTVHGGKDGAKAGEDAFKGLEKCCKVAVHYTAEGGKDTADEAGHKVVQFLRVDNFGVVAGEAP